MTSPRSQLDSAGACEITDSDDEPLAALMQPKQSQPQAPKRPAHPDGEVRARQVQKCFERLDAGLKRDDD